MKLFTKTLVAVGLLVTSAAWGDICNSGNPNNLTNVPAYQRTIVLSHSQPNFEPYIDPGHNLMLTRYPLYQPSDVTKLTADCNAFFLAYYGLDFDPETNKDNVIPTSDGAGLLVLDPTTKVAIAAKYPVIFGLDADLNPDYALVLDTANTNWNLTHAWFYLEVSEGVQFINPYTVPKDLGFAQAGVQAQPSDILFFGYIELLANGTDLTKPVNREHMTFQTNQLIKVSVTEFPDPKDIAYHIYYDVYDANGRLGRWQAPSIVTHSNPNGLNDVAQRINWPVFTWYCPGSGPGQPPSASTSTPVAAE